MVLDLSPELVAVKAERMEPINQFPENQGGKSRITYIKSFLSKLSYHNEASDKHLFSWDK